MCSTSNNTTNTNTACYYNLMFLSEWREFPSAPCLAGGGGKLDSSRLDVVEIARVPDMLPSLFPSWSG